MHEALRKYISRTVEISPTELDSICACFQEEKVAKGTILLASGQHSRFTYFVLEGCLRLYYSNEEGQESTRYIAFENQMATALVSFVSGKATAESLQAMEPSTLLAISHDNFTYLRSEIPAFDLFYVRYIEKAYVNTVTHLFTFTQLDATERYLRLLRQNPEVVQRLPNKIVASYLQISQETLSRLKVKCLRR